MSFLEILLKGVEYIHESDDGDVSFK